jgi:hypothetical protein
LDRRPYHFQIVFLRERFQRLNASPDDLAFGAAGLQVAIASLASAKLDVGAQDLQPAIEVRTRVLAGAPPHGKGFMPAL